MQRTAHSQSFTPLPNVLQQLDFWLSRDGASRVIVAEATVKTLKRQTLPEHVHVTHKKRQGKRKAVRGRRHYQQPRHKLAYWPEDGLDENVLPSLACVVRGQADFIIADYVLHCSTGDWVLFPAGVPKQDGSKPHFEGSSTGRQCDVLWLCNGLNVSQELLCWVCRSEGDLHLSGAEMESICAVQHHFLTQLFLGFCEEAQVKRRSEIVLFLLRSLLLMLKGEIEAGHFAHHSAPQNNRLNPNDPIEMAQEYIQENIYKHLTISHVARQVLVSPTTLTRCFRQQTSQTFNQYLNEQRLQLAEKLLKTTNMPVSEVARCVGVKYCQLRTLFLKHHGCSPGQFRTIRE